jgi:alpha-1,3-rhamnosyltransferase
MNEVKNNKPTVSVFVPSYNHAPFVERCLKSIIKQTRAPSELLVIDDGSKDDSPKVIESVLKDCPFPTELMARPNKGLCATLNEGFEKTSGEYFAYIGSDDIWLSEFLEARVQLLESNPDAVLGYGHAYLIDERDQIISCSNEWGIYNEGGTKQMLWRGIAPVSSTVFYRRSALAKRRWNEGAKLEDYELYLQLCYDGEFAFDARALSAWRHHGYNTSGDWSLMLKECLEAQTRIASSLNLSDDELKQIQTATRFQFVEEFIRKGLKSTALSLMLRNMSGAPSMRVIAKRVIQLAIPAPLMRLRRNIVKRNTIERYGVLKV